MGHLSLLTNARYLTAFFLTVLWKDNAIDYTIFLTVNDVPVQNHIKEADLYGHAVKTN